jgi:hypothetical protein
MRSPRLASNFRRFPDGLDGPSQHHRLRKRAPHRQWLGHGVPAFHDHHVEGVEDNLRAGAEILERADRRLARLIERDDLPSMTVSSGIPARAFTISGYLGLFRERNWTLPSLLIAWARNHPARGHCFSTWPAMGKALAKALVRLPVTPFYFDYVVTVLCDIQWPVAPVGSASRTVRSFPAPSPRTGRADFQHSALLPASPPGLGDVTYPAGSPKPTPHSLRPLPSSPDRIAPDFGSCRLLDVFIMRPCLPYQRRNCVAAGLLPSRSPDIPPGLRSYEPIRHRLAVRHFPG